MNENIKNFFDSIAVNYEHQYSSTIDELIDSLSIAKNSRILDLGCGKGIISSKLASILNAEVVALDLSSKMIEYAKDNVKDKNITFINGDYYAYKDEKKFDVIVCFDAYPHFMDVDGFISKSVELVKKDGLLAVIHDIGRGELNKHHASHAVEVSRLLKEPEKEVIPYLTYFKPIELSESENNYKMILIKK